jgi:uncharacterized OsmC-like protein
LTQKLYANAKLIRDLRLAVDNGRSHSVLLDLPIDEGTDMGPTPLELCVMSYAGCFAIIFARTARKMRIPLKDLEVYLEAVETDEARTVTQARFDIAVKTDAPEDRIQRMFKLTVQDCAVGKIFESAGVKIGYNMRTVRE